MSSSPGLVVITCAAGKQSPLLIPHLYDTYPLRLVVQSSASAGKLRAHYPEADVVQADLAQPHDCTRILAGAAVVYHVGPSIHPHEKEIGLNMVDAAVAESSKPAGTQFRHFVFSSVLNTQLRKMFNHDDKRYVEEYLIESGLSFTILQPGDFVDYSFPVRMWLDVLSKGNGPPVWIATVAAQSRSSLVFLKDLAEAAAKVIKEGERHYQAQYPLVSLGPITRGDILKQIEELLGTKIETRQLDVESMADMLLSLVFPDGDIHPRSRDAAERLVLFYRRRGLQGNSNVLEWLLGRKPTTLQEYVDEQKAALQGTRTA